MHKRLVTGFIACLMLALPAAQAQTFEMVSLTNSGLPPAFAPAGISHQAAVTPDGRYVVFEGGYSGLVTSPLIIGSYSQIYLRDRVAGTTELISQSTNGFAASGGDSSRPTISNDGCRVVFLSYASNLIDGFPTATQHVFLRNRCTTAGTPTPTTTMVDVLPGGSLSAGQALEARLSGDGRTVALTSYSLLVAGLKLHDGVTSCSGIYSAVYLRHINSATTTALMRPDGGCIWGDEPDISYDGTRVAFWSISDPLNRHADVWQIYLFDVTVGPSSLAIVSADANGLPQRASDPGHGGEGFSTIAAPALSQDGRRVAFRSHGAGLWPNLPLASNWIIGQVYVKDTYTGAIVVASVDSTGTILGDGDSSGSGYGDRPGLSSDGQYVVFRTAATNIATETGSGFVLHNLYGGTIGLTNISTQGMPELSPSGRFLTIHSGNPMDPRFTSLTSRGMFLFDLGILYAPTITRLTPGGGKIRIEFTPSTANATAASSYIAICQAADGSGNSATGSSSPLTVTGLTNGVSYVCTVTAVNALGLFSTASNMMSKRAGADLTSILMLLLD